jgi:hypothetical protein
MRPLIVDIDLIACFGALGALTVIYPQKMYDYFIFGMGCDNHRRFSPERGRGYRLAVRFQGIVMLFGAVTMLLLLITSK